MRKILLQRLLQAVLMAWSVGTLTFIITRSLPGDMAYKIAAGRYGDDAVSTSAANAVAEELGLHRSAFEQYVSWMTDLASLDLGNSLVTGAPIVVELQNQLSYTLVLAGLAILVSALIAFPLGIYSGIRSARKSENTPKSHASLFDKTALVFSTFVRSQPVFCLGLILIFIFALELKWLPVAGSSGFVYTILPVMTLGLSLAAISNRVIRNSTVNAVQSGYFHFAKIKGLSALEAFRCHALPNIVIPALAFMGIQLIGLIEGVIMIESLFAWPGIGHGLSHAVFARDITMLQGTALLMGILFVLVNTLVDLSQYALDPRVRENRGYSQ